MPPSTVRRAHHTREAGQLCRWCVFPCAAEEVPICCARWCFSCVGPQWGAKAGPTSPPHCCWEMAEESRLEHIIYTSTQRCHLYGSITQLSQFSSSNIKQIKRNTKLFSWNLQYYGVRFVVRQSFVIVRHKKRTDVKILPRHGSALPLTRILESVLFLQWCNISSLMCCMSVNTYCVGIIF